MPGRAGRARAKALITDSLLEKLKSGKPFDDADVEYAEATLGEAEARYVRRRQVASRAAELTAIPEVIGLLPAAEGPARDSAARRHETTEDWVSKFWDDAGLVSDEMLQELYARVLTREAASPGACSVRTLRVMRYLDRPTADLFGRLLTVTFDDRWVPNRPKILETFGVPYSAILDLDDAGLISATPASLKLSHPQPITFFRHGQFVIRVDNGAHLEQIAQFALTKSGRELARIADVTRSKEIVISVAAWLAREDPEWLAASRRRHVTDHIGMPTQPPARSPDFRVGWAELPHRHWEGDPRFLNWNEVSGEPPDPTDPLGLNG